MSRMPPGFGDSGGAGQSSQQNAFQPQQQDNNILFAQPGTLDGSAQQQQQQQDRVGMPNMFSNNSANASSWGAFQNNFSQLKVNDNNNNTQQQQSRQGPLNNNNTQQKSNSGPYNYAAAAAAKSGKKNNANDGLAGQMSQLPQQQQFLGGGAPLSWNQQQGSLNTPNLNVSGPNPLSQLAAQQQELIKLQESLMQMMQSQAQAGFKDPQVFMDLQRQQAIATAQLQSMQDAFRVQQKNVPSSFSNQANLASWPIRQSSAPPNLQHSGGNNGGPASNMMNPYLQQHQNRGRINSGSSTGSSSSVGYGIGNNQQYQKEPMTYGAVVASGGSGNNSGLPPRSTSGVSSRGYSSNHRYSNDSKGGYDSNKGKRGGASPGKNERRSPPEIPNEKALLDGSERRTTLMIRNIPNKYTQSMLLEELNEVLHRKFDFFYLPIDFRKKTNMGYAFINMIDPVATVVLVKQFHGKGWRSSKSEKICQISYARIQGKHALVEQFRNSTVMSKKKQYRPIIFHSSGPAIGTPEQFPPGNNQGQGGKLSSGGRV